MPLQRRNTKNIVSHVSIATWSVIVQKRGDPEL